jgi:isochorismate hydrolase
MESEAHEELLLSDRWGPSVSRGRKARKADDTLRPRRHDIHPMASSG